MDSMLIVSYLILNLVKHTMAKNNLIEVFRSCLLYSWTEVLFSVGSREESIYVMIFRWILQYVEPLAAFQHEPETLKHCCLSLITCWSFTVHDSFIITQNKLCVFFVVWAWYIGVVWNCLDMLSKLTLHSSWPIWPLASLVLSALHSEHWTKVEVVLNVLTCYDYYTISQDLYIQKTHRAPFEASFCTTCTAW